MGKNYTVTMPVDMNGSASPYKQLQQLTAEAHLPEHILCEDQQTIFLNKRLRLLPKKRLVALCTFQGKPAVAKIFFHRFHAHKHFQREINGSNRLLELNIPHPSILYLGKTADRQVYVIIYEKIAASNLADYLHKCHTLITAMPILKLLMIELATQHVIGLCQNDLHLDNYLVTSNKIYTLDGANISFQNDKISRLTSIKNLALLLSQLGTNIKDYQKLLFSYYAQHRGWLVKPADLTALYFYIEQWQDSRWRRYKQKIFRNSSDNYAIKSPTQHIFCKRQHYSASMKNFLHAPTEFLKAHPTQILKAGNSASVFLVTIGQQPYVVKRYNHKSWWHTVKRAYRYSRAENSWLAAHKLQLFDIATATPIALIQNYRFFLKTTAYLITLPIAGKDIKAYLQTSNVIDQQQCLLNLTDTFSSLIELKLTHGDLKSTNLLVDDNKQICLIDLDGCHEHNNINLLKRQWHKEIKRFIKNFVDTASLTILVKQFFIQQGWLHGKTKT